MQSSISFATFCSYDLEFEQKVAKEEEEEAFRVGLVIVPAMRRNVRSCGNPCQQSLFIGDRAPKGAAALSWRREPPVGNAILREAP